jgi:hypothetical protein
MMLNKLFSFLRGLFNRSPVRFAIVRRYADANGSYVGELYMEQTVKNVISYNMIGASLDTLPLESAEVLTAGVAFDLDTKNDFLIPMPLGTLRVGALDPKDNDRVRRMVASLPRRRMMLVVQNRFIEHVMERKT